MILDLNWELIFKLDSFLIYCTRNELLIISSLNKALRDKLKYKIFNRICIRASDLESDVEYFGNNKSINDKSSITIKFMNYFSSSENESETFNRTKLNPWINKFMQGLLINSSFVNCITLTNINKPGYYIFPVLNIFLNLKYLKLVKLSVSLEDFFKLLNFLELMEILEVEEVELIKSNSNEELNAKSIKLPIKLKELVYNQVIITNSNSTNNALDFLYGNGPLESQQFNLPIQSLPNLLKLWYLNSGISPTYINEYLCFNPQLTNLKIESKYLITENLDIISSFNTLNTLIIIGNQNDSEFLNLTNFPELKSINSLILINIYSNSYKLYLDLIKNCTHLKILELSIISEEFGFYPEFSNNMTNLKELKIKLV